MTTSNGKMGYFMFRPNIDVFYYCTFPVKANLYI